MSAIPNPAILSEGCARDRKHSRNPVILSGGVLRETRSTSAVEGPPFDMRNDWLRKAFPSWTCIFSLLRFEPVQ